jgi:hypothetical protein
MRNVKHDCETPTQFAKTGDIWRCWCGKLWRLGRVCDACDYRAQRGLHLTHHGQCVVRDPWGNRTTWRTVSLKRRIIHRLHSRRWRGCHELQVSLIDRINQLESDLVEPRRQTGTDWLYTVRE